MHNPIMMHTLALLQSSPYFSGEFCCNICYEEGCGPVYHCSDCDFDIHVSCAAIGPQQTHFTHPHHPLHLSHAGSKLRRCDSCSFSIRTWSFRCDTCDFDIHPVCARAPRCILHPRHPDPLVLSDSANVPGPNICDGCKMPVRGLFYRCQSCHYNLDQVCARLPSEIKHARHQHMLSLINQSIRQGGSPLCNICRQEVKGLGFHCHMCNFNLHSRCAELVHELPHVDVDKDPQCESSSSTQTVLHRSSASVSSNVSHTLIPSKSGSSASVSSNVSDTLMPSKSDWEAVERVLRFAQEKAKAEESHPPEQIEEEDECPTCLEGFSLANPKKSTSCGHHFHLPCILEWLEQSNNCPLCRKHFTLVI